jgi:hypothetical protein
MISAAASRFVGVAARAVGRSRWKHSSHSRFVQRFSAR